MNDKIEPAHPKENEKCASQGRDKRCAGKKGKFVFFGLGFILLAFSAGIFMGAGQSFAGLGHHGFGSGWCIFGGEHGKKAESMVSHILDKVDATDEQKTKASAIVASHTESFKERYNGFKEFRDETTRLLTARNIDRPALEKLRQEKMKSLDETSQEMVAIIADIADILTPEQRKKLAALHKEKKCSWSSKS